ncbi:MAG: serine/threonine protein phosphatase [Desulfuromonadaceae bacterium]|nr:serine/threonine protein phosphatase [Desulfuromonadaceae bacterium]
MKIPFFSGKKSSDANRLIAVGDIHGCLAALQHLMEKVKPTVEDQVVFLGDYIDRGPNSRGVIDFLIDFQKCFPKTVCLKGNHEAMLIDFLRGKNRDLFLLNGGISTLRLYDTDGSLHLPPDHLEFLYKLLPFYRTESFIFVHAGLRPGVPLEEQTEQDLLWIRGDFLYYDFDWGGTVVFGHTPLDSPLQEVNKIGLDTGAVYGRVLTACDVRRRRFWSVRGEKTKKA